jgi:hypothetical protein
LPVAAGGTGRCTTADVMLGGKYFIPKVSSGPSHSKVDHGGDAPR